MKFKCGCTPELEKRMKLRRILMDIKPKSSGKVKYISQYALDRLNPYIASIIGNSCLILSAFGNFKLFFATTNTAEIDAYFTSLGGTVPTVIPFSDAQKEIITKAFQLTCDYIGVTLEIVEDFSLSNYVQVNCESLEGTTLAFTLSPDSLDNNPDTLEKFYLAYNEALLGSFTTDPGGVYMLTAMHELGHTLGLMHPHDTGGGSKIMPGVTDATQTSNLGVCYMNTTLSTIMSYVSPQFSDDPNKTTYARTLMTMDYQAYRWYYKGAATENYINNWLDLSCKSGVVQTITSTTTGVELTLVPQDDTETGYNLVAYRFQANPMQDLATVTELISTNVLGYDPANEKFAVTLFDTFSFPSSVKISYNTFNCYAWSIWRSFTIEVVANVENINIWFQGYSTQYNVSQTDTEAVITNIKNNNKVTITNLSGAITLFIGYAINNKS